MADTNTGGRDRLVQFLLTVVLSIAAVRWLRGGKRVRGLLAGVGALGLGFNATTGYCSVDDALDIDATEVPDISVDEPAADVDGPAPETRAESDDAPDAESATLHCDVCGEAIVPGQRRGPTEDGEIAHADCR
jgi:hypothetical protein